MAHVACNAFLFYYVRSKVLIYLVLDRGDVFWNLREVCKKSIIFILFWALRRVKHLNKLVEFLTKISIVFKVAHALFHRCI